MIALRDLARRILSPWTLILIGVLALITLAAGAVRYTLAIPSGSIAAYSEPGVFVAQAPPPTWPAWLFRLQQDDMADPSASRLSLHEGGRALGPSHTAVADIGAHGKGRFAHWDGAIYFSASDNTDPRTNGRTYLARSTLHPQPAAWSLAAAPTLLGFLWLLLSPRRRPVLFQATLRWGRPLLYTCAALTALVSAWVSFTDVFQTARFTAIMPVNGHAYVAPIAPPSGVYSWLTRRSDHDSPSVRPSTLLLENGERIGYARATLALVEQIGSGLYMYDNGVIYFSTPDGTDPRTNGRTYAARVRLATPVWFETLSVLVWALAAFVALWHFRTRGRAIALCLCSLSATGALVALATHANLITYEEFVPRGLITPSTPTTFVAEHREIVAPFILAAPPDSGPFDLIEGEHVTRCIHSLFMEGAPTEGFRCARRANGYQVDFAPVTAGVDARLNPAPYAVRYPVRAHTYLIVFLLATAAAFGAIAFYRPTTRTIVGSSGALIAIAGIALTLANIAGLFLSLRSPQLSTLADTFHNYDLRMSYDDALIQLERRPEDTDATYAQRATFALNSAIVHAAPATELNKWRMHLPIWENWPLHFLGYSDPKVRRYIFWDARKHLERGIGLCGDISSVLIAFLRENGVEARTVSVGGHIVVEAQVAPGNWRLFDADYGVIVPHSLDAVEADPTLVAAAYTRWAEEHPDLDEYTRNFAATVIPSFFASMEDNSVDPTGRTGFYSGLARSTEAYIAREALLYRIKWVVPFVLIFIGLGVALLAWPPRRQPN